MTVNTEVIILAQSHPWFQETGTVQMVDNSRVFVARHRWSNQGDWFSPDELATVEDGRDTAPLRHACAGGCHDQPVTAGECCSCLCHGKRANARVHRSTAYVKAISERGSARKPDPITDQFRFIVRMAVACHVRAVPYDLTWDRRDSATRATITARGKIPTPKPLPKPPKLKLVADWKPAIWDAAYRLEAYYDSNRKRKCPGFVIEHSCGLSLVHPSESGELGVTEYGENEDIRQRWFVTHTASGRGFGLTLNFKRATDALLLAASFAVDWTADADALKGNSEFRRAGYSVQAAFSKGYEKDAAKRRLAELECAA